MDNQSIKNKIIDKIKTGEVKIKPKIYFALNTALIILGIIITGIFTLFLISFISFALKASGLWFMPNLGFYGFGMFFKSLPWILIIAVLLLIVLLEIAAKHFSFVYRKPILYSLLFIVLIVFLAGFMIDQTPFHSKLFLKAKEGELPLAGPMYRDFGMPDFRNIHRGIVSDITENGFVMKTTKEQELNVLVGPETKLKPDFEIKTEDEVVVFGERNNGTIKALNIRKVDDNLELFRQMQPLPPHMLKEK